MSYSQLTLRNVVLILSTLVLSLPTLSAHAGLRNIAGIIVDSESRKELDDVSVELLEAGKAKHQLTTNSGKPFSIEYNFKEDTDYKLVFTKADYYPHKIDLSNALNSGKMPEVMTISLSGEESSVVFWGESLNRDTGKAVSNTKVTTVNLMTGEQSVSNADQKGRYHIDVTSGYDYEVSVESSDHLKRFARINYCKDRLEKSYKYCFSGFNNVSLNEQGGIYGASLLLDKIEVGKRFKVDNIYYEYNKATIKKHALPNLLKVMYTLIDNPQITIELGSHADSRGSDSYNLSLSQRRADSAVEYIIKQGIGRERITSKGYGETILLNHCKNGVTCSDQEHGENRRTEFTIIGFDETYVTKE